MDTATIGTLSFVMAVSLLFLRVPVSFTLLTTSFTCTYLFFAFRQGRDVDLIGAIDPTMSLMLSSGYEFLHSYTLSIIPMFILLGHLAYHIGITQKIYHSIRLWLGKMPGGLAMASVIGCGGFSAVTGSSMACASAMGRICVPEMLKYRYSPEMATSSIAVGGTLGSLIPPSILFILYAIFAEESVNQLFLAGVLPGLLSLGGYLLVIFTWAKLQPNAAPVATFTVTAQDHIRALIDLAPAIVLLLIIIGGLYSGFFSANDLAGISVFLLVVYGFLCKKLSLKLLILSLRETAEQSAPLLLIAMGATMLSSFVALSGFAGYMSNMVTEANLTPTMLILAIVAIYLIMGCLFDPIGIMVLTLPFMIPLIEDANLNLIWFGVLVVKLLEIGLITPPFGLNVFVVNGVTSNDIKIQTIFKGILKFFIIEAIVLVLLISFPDISLLLPNTVYSR